MQASAQKLPPRSKSREAVLLPASAPRSVQVANVPKGVVNVVRLDASDGQIGLIERQPGAPTTLEARPGDRPASGQGSDWCGDPSAVRFGTTEIADATYRLPVAPNRDVEVPVRSALRRRDLGLGRAPVVLSNDAD